jgi:hypothetical protein
MVRVLSIQISTRDQKKIGLTYVQKSPPVKARDRRIPKEFNLMTLVLLYQSGHLASTNSSKNE